MAADKSEITRALEILFHPRDTIELRCFLRGSAILNGYYRNRDRLIADAVSINQDLTPQLSIYTCLNPCQPELYARRPDKFERAGSGDGVSQSEVLLRRWLLVDCDPDRPKGVSATDKQKAAAQELVQAAYRYLIEHLHLPRPIVGDSGSGFHLLLPLADLPNDSGSKWACQQLLKQVAENCKHQAAHIDASMFDSNRVCKLPGTIARKGADIPEQPHRLAKLLSIPDPIQPICLDQLLAIVGQPPGQAAAASPQPGDNGSGWDIPALLEQRGIQYTEVQDTSDSGERWTKYSFDCPFSQEHSDGFVLGQWDSGAIFAKCHHDSCQSKGWQDLKQIWELPGDTGISEADIILPAQQAAVIAAPPAPQLAIVSSQDVQCEPIAWLWQDRLVIGGINLCAGRGGIGKTYFLCDLVARLTNSGLRAPNGQPLEHGRVLYSTGEDHIAKVIEPRMQQHAADRSRLEYIKGLPAGPYLRLLDVIEHCDLLRDSLRQRPDTVALVLDPISSFQGDTDSNKVAAVRRFTAVLTQLAEEFNLAVIGIHHFSKAKRDVAGDAISGSHAYRDAARSIWLFALDGNDPGRRLMVCDKHNWAEHRPPGLAYRIEAGRIQYEAEPLEMSADELLAQGIQQPVEVAFAWLLAQLSAGPQPAINLQIAATAEGIAERTLNRAKKRLGVVSRKQGERWIWALPAATDQEQQ